MDGWSLSVLAWDMVFASCGWLRMEEFLLRDAREEAVAVVENEGEGVIGPPTPEATENLEFVIDLGDLWKDAAHVRVRMASRGRVQDRAERGARNLVGDLPQAQEGPMAMGRRPSQWNEILKELETFPEGMRFRILNKIRKWVGVRLDGYCHSVVTLGGFLRDIAQMNGVAQEQCEPEEVNLANDIADRMIQDLDAAVLEDKGEGDSARASRKVKRLKLHRAQSNGRDRPHWHGRGPTGRL